MAEKPLQAPYRQSILVVGKRWNSYLAILHDVENDDRFRKEYQGEDFLLRPLGGRVFLFVAACADEEAVNLLGQLLSLRDKVDLIALGGTPEVFERKR